MAIANRAHRPWRRRSSAGGNSYHSLQETRVRTEEAKIYNPGKGNADIDADEDKAVI